MFLFVANTVNFHVFATLFLGIDSIYSAFHLQLFFFLMMTVFSIFLLIQMTLLGPGNLAQLVGTLHNLCRGRGSNPGHPTSPHLIVELQPLGY